MATRKRKTATPGAATAGAAVAAGAEKPTAQSQADQPTATPATDDLSRLLDGLARRGVVINLNAVDVNNLRAHVQASAALQLLVENGICTPDEVQAAVNETIRALLAGLLQAIEETQLKAAKSIQTVQKPPIQIARVRD